MYLGQISFQTADGRGRAGRHQAPAGDDAVHRRPARGALQQRAAPPGLRAGAARVRDRAPGGHRGQQRRRQLRGVAGVGRRARGVREERGRGDRRDRGRGGPERVGRRARPHERWARSPSARAACGSSARWRRSRRRSSTTTSASSRTRSPTPGTSCCATRSSGRRARSSATAARARASPPAAGRVHRLGARLPQRHGARHRAQAAADRLRAPGRPADHGRRVPDVEAAAASSRSGWSRASAASSGRSPGRSGEHVRGRKVTDGYYFVRLRMNLGASKADYRRVTLRRENGRWLKRPPHYRKESCALLTSYKLLRPGVRRAGRPRGHRVVPADARARGRGSPSSAAGGSSRAAGCASAARDITHRTKLSARGLPRGDYRFILRVRPLGGGKDDARGVDVAAAVVVRTPCRPGHARKR